MIEKQTHDQYVGPEWSPFKVEFHKPWWECDYIVWRTVDVVGEVVDEGKGVPSGITVDSMTPGRFVVQVKAKDTGEDWPAEWHEVARYEVVPQEER